MIVCIALIEATFDKCVCVWGGGGGGGGTVHLILSHCNCTLDTVSNLVPLYIRYCF